MTHPPSNMACDSFRRFDPSRRALLRAGGAGLLGLSMPKLLRAAELSKQTIKPRAKSIIFLFQWGGPSHIDMFDLKPNAPDTIRGPHGSIPSAIPGLPVNEHLPRTAKVLDRFSVIRSMTHEMNNHNSAGYYAITGHRPPTDDQRLRDSLDLYPAYGSVVDALAPTDGAMPTFVAYPHVIADGSRTPGQHASFLGKSHDPLYVGRDPNSPDFALPELSLPDGVSIDRLNDRRSIQKIIDRQARLAEYSAEARGLDEYYDKALTMLSSPKVRQAFNLSDEPAEVRDAYGRTTYGQSCLLARRLVERGVKVVTVYFAQSIGGGSANSGGWDTHGNNGNKMFPIVEKYQYPLTEQTLPTLILDLEERGLLDETLVLWTGEFGRTPTINNQASRDHWPRCYTALLAGAGVKRGFVHGASDERAMHPIDDPVRPENLAATLYHLLGIDPATEVYDTQNRPLPIANGDPVMEVMT